MHYLTLLRLAFLFFFSQVQAAPPIVEIYTIPNCMGCSWVKDLLKEHGVPYKEISIRGRPDLYAEMKQRAGGNPDDSMTVPRIFINGKHIGGYSDLQEIDLDKLMDKQNLESK